MAKKSDSNNSVSQPQNDFDRILHLCDWLQRYRDSARRWRDARQVQNEAIQADRERQISGDELRRAVVIFDAANKSLAFDDGAWLDELVHLLVMHSLIGLIPSLDESRRTHIYPHHIAGFDWQAFAKELLEVRDAATRLLFAKSKQTSGSGSPKGVTRTDAAFELQSMSDDEDTSDERRKRASDISQKWLKRRTIKWPSSIGIDPQDRQAALFDVVELVTVLADAERGEVIKYGGEKKLVGKLRKRARESLSVAECIAIRARRATRTTRTSAKSKKTSPAKTRRG